MMGIGTPHVLSLPMIVGPDCFQLRFHRERFNDRNIVQPVEPGCIYRRGLKPLLGLNTVRDRCMVSGPKSNFCDGHHISPAMPVCGSATANAETCVPARSGWHPNSGLPEFGVV